VFALVGAAVWSWIGEDKKNAPALLA